MQTSLITIMLLYFIFLSLYTRKRVKEYYKTFQILVQNNVLINFQDSEYSVNEGDVSFTLNTDGDGQDDLWDYSSPVDLATKGKKKGLFIQNFLRLITF